MGIFERAMIQPNNGKPDALPMYTAVRSIRQGETPSPANLAVGGVIQSLPPFPKDRREYDFLHNPN